MDGFIDFPTFPIERVPSPKPEPDERPNPVTPPVPPIPKKNLMRNAKRVACPVGAYACRSPNFPKGGSSARVPCTDSCHVKGGFPKGVACSGVGPALVSLFFGHEIGQHWRGVLAPFALRMPWLVRLMAETPASGHRLASRAHRKGRA